MFRFRILHGWIRHNARSWDIPQHYLDRQAVATSKFTRSCRCNVRVVKIWAACNQLAIAKYFCCHSQIRREEPNVQPRRLLYFVSDTGLRYE